MGVDFACHFRHPNEIDVKRFEMSHLAYLRIRIDFQERSIFDEKCNLKRFVIAPEMHTMHQVVVAANRIGKTQRHAFSLITGGVCARRDVSLLAAESLQ